jgi:putative protease
LAEKPQQAENTIKTQLSKLGDTIFSANRVDINFEHTYFFPSSQISFWRKELINKLLDKLLDTNKPQPIERHISAPKTAENTSFMDNISNKNAANFYLENGTKNIAWAFELEKYPKAVLMQCKYCIKYELGWCSKQKNNNFPKHKEPLFLSYNKKLFKLKFDCKKCEMWIESCE